MAWSGALARPAGSNGASSLVDSRIERERFTEGLVNTARFFGVALGILQFGVFTDYPPMVRELGFVIGLLYGVVGLVSRRELRRRTRLEEVRRLTTTTLVLDSVLLATTALALAYQNDPTNLFLMVLALLEAAMKRQVPGAIALAAAGVAVEVGRVLLRIHVHDLPVVPAESTFFGGMLFLIALFAGGTVRLQMAAQDELARSNDRLRAMGRLLRSGIDSFSGGTGLEQILHEAVDGLDLDAAIVRPATGPPVGWPPETTRDPVVDVLARELTHVAGDDPVLSHTDGQGRAWLAMPLSTGSDGTSVLVVQGDGEGTRADAEAVQAELRAVLRASAALAVEDEMREARRSLDRLRHDIVAVTTHELRTPVTIIRGALETIERNVDPASQWALLSSIEGAAGRLQGVVDNLQIISRLDSGDFGANLQHVDVADVLADVAQMQDTVEVRVSGLHTIAWADADLVHTVLRCLIDNAITHGDGREVRVDAHLDGERVVVDVSDAGPGIPLQARARVFERFAAASASNHGRGAGIGLPLARELARLMDGDVALLDEERTTFRLELPRAGSDA